MKLPKQSHPPKLTGWARAAQLKEAAKRHISGGAPKVNGAGGFEKKKLYEILFGVCQNLLRGYSKYVEKVALVRLGQNSTFCPTKRSRTQKVS